MNKNLGVIIGAVALTLIIGGVYLSKNKNDEALLAKEQVERNVMEEQKMVEEKDMMEKKVMEENEVMDEGGITKTDTVMDKEEVSMKNETEVKMDKEEVKMMDNLETVTKVGVYEVYSPEKIARAAAGDVVLFFKADWCPTCRAVDADITENRLNIPGGLNILKVDYDNSTELKKKYGVTYQHTFVQVDAQGNMVKKWSGSETLLALVSKVQ